MEICMTHPEILEIEAFGFVPRWQKEPVAVCIRCGYGINAEEDHYNTPDGAVCDGCKYDYMDEYMKQFRKVGA